MFFFRTQIKRINSLSLVIKICEILTYFSLMSLANNICGQ